MSVNYELKNNIAVITIDRPERMNAVDYDTARDLYRAFRAFNADSKAHVAVLTGAGRHFCTGADLKAIAEGEDIETRVEGISLQPDIGRNFGPMGPTRLKLDKPVIAAIEGNALAGGLELAIWCDLRVASMRAVLGVKCRERGVPLVDGGTVRLPRLIGQSRAADLILTGRDVKAKEAKEIGLVNYLAPPGRALHKAMDIAAKMAAHPQTCLCKDWDSARAQWDLPAQEALDYEKERGLETIRSGETLKGAASFAQTRPKF